MSNGEGGITAVDVYVAWLERQLESDGKDPEKIAELLDKEGLENSVFSFFEEHNQARVKPVLLLDHWQGEHQWRPTVSLDNEDFDPALTAQGVWRPVLTYNHDLVPRVTWVDADTVTALFKGMDADGDLVVSDAANQALDSAAAAAADIEYEREKLSSASVDAVFNEEWFRLFQTSIFGTNSAQEVVGLVANFASLIFSAKQQYPDADVEDLIDSAQVQELASLIAGSMQTLKYDPELTFQTPGWTPDGLDRTPNRPVIKRAIEEPGHSL
jgi:hypothetical protein